MNFKRIIKEEIDDFGWVRETRPDLYNKIIVFEPMIDYDEYKKVYDKLIAINDMGADIRWWSEKDLSKFNPMGEDYYLHHLIVGLDGKMVYGALDSYEVDAWRIDDYTEDEIRNFYDKEEDIDLFIEDFSDNFNNPEEIDGRKYFDLPYTKPINESDDFFDSLKDDETKPKIIPGGILDTEVGNFSKDEILARLHELGYTWNGGSPIFSDGNLTMGVFRYVFIGPIKDPVGISQLQILHDTNLNWTKAQGLEDLVYRT
jgi:hypothetical protein